MSKGTILIADDEQDIRDLLCDFLGGEGYQCLSAFDAFDALEKFRISSGIDLVMSDIRMPGKSGLDLLEEVKKVDEDVIVIMISAVKDIESAISAMSKGAYDYVSKPFKLNEVAVVANKAMEKRRLILENKEYQRELEMKVEARTIELRKALEELDRTYKFTLSALVTALDTRDTETQGHSLRVVRYTLELAGILGIKDKGALKELEYGALLHDIGKIGIPDAILRKAGKLTLEEWSIMKTHPVIGYDILKKIKFLEESAQIVLHHHEKFDGTGYPDGLKGTEIPVGSRIFAVADAFDAMTSQRPYRSPIHIDKVAEELRKISGTQFDPDIVSAFYDAGLDFWGEVGEAINIQISEDPDFFLK